jgi:hypothetical protein
MNDHDRFPWGIILTPLVVMLLLVFLAYALPRSTTETYCGEVVAAYYAPQWGADDTVIEFTNLTFRFNVELAQLPVKGTEYCVEYIAESETYYHYVRGWVP